MATEKSRTLKLSILGDVDNLLDSFKKAEKATNSHTDNLQDYAKKAAVAFAAVTAAGAAFAASAVKNAMADEAAQRKLAETLKASTDATDQQIAAVAKWIDKTSVQIGVTDDQLRPAYARLVRSTNDVENSQKLLNLALDISAATGKPLEAVANALGKAYDGNTQALGKLGLGIDQSIIKSGDFNSIFQTLTGTFGNFAENEAMTTEGRFRTLTIALDEAKEAIGAALLPIVEKFATFLVDYGIPVLESFVGGLTGEGGLVDGATSAMKTAWDFGNQLRTFLKIVWSVKEELLVLGAVIAAVFVTSKIAGFVTATIAAIKGLIAAYNALKASAIVAGIASYFALNPLAGIAASAVAVAVMAGAAKLADQYSTSLPSFNVPTVSDQPFTFTSPTSGGTLNIPENPLAGTSGGVSGAGKTTSVNYTSLPAGWSGNLEQTLTMLNAQSNLAKAQSTLKELAIGQAASMFALGQNRQAVQDYVVNNYFTVQGAVDPEGTARTIIDILNQAQARGTLGAGALK